MKLKLSGILLVMLLLGVGGNYVQGGEFTSLANDP